MLVAHTFNGLANRMHWAVSSMILAERLNRECRIVWPCTRDLCCPFYDLFQRKGPDLLNIPDELREGACSGREPEWLPRFVSYFEDSRHPFRAGEVDSSLHPRADGRRGRFRPGRGDSSISEVATSSALAL